MMKMLKKHKLYRETVIIFRRFDPDVRQILSVYNAMRKIYLFSCYSQNSKKRTCIIVVKQVHSRQMLTSWRALYQAGTCYNETL